jgi:hypothetical protein
MNGVLIRGCILIYFEISDWEQAEGYQKMAPGSKR